MPAGGTWTMLAPLPTARFGHAAAGAGGVLYVIGGAVVPNTCGTVGNLDAYDPVSNAWSARAPMPTARSGLAVGVLGASLYAVGGGVGCGVYTTALEVYDPTTNRWGARAPMAVPRTGHVAVAANGMLYAIAGITSGNALTASVEAYDPATDTWSARAPIPTPRFRAVAGVVNGVIYVAGGTTFSGPPLGSVEAYDPATDTWTTKAAMPTARMWLAGDVLDGRLYAMGGRTETEPVATVESYDPATDTWRSETSMPTIREDFAVAAVDGALYAVGGQNLAFGGGPLSVVEGFTPAPLPPGVYGNLLGPDGTSICNAVPPNTRLRVDVLIPDFVQPAPAFAGQQFVTCPSNRFEIALTEGSYALRVQFPPAAVGALLPWRVLDPVPLVVAGQGVVRDIHIEEGVPLGGRATVNGAPYGGAALDLAYDQLPRFGAATGRSQDDGTWADFFGRAPLTVQAGMAFRPNRGIGDCLVPGTRMLAPLPGSFRVPDDLTSLDCAMETAPATAFSHRASRLLVTPLPGDLVGQSPELLGTYGRGWGAVFPLDPSFTPAAGDIHSPVLFAGALMIGAGSDLVLSGANVSGYLACAPDVNAACRDLGLDAVLATGSDAHLGQEVTWSYSDAASDRPLGLRIVQRSYAGAVGHDYVLYRFSITSTAPAPVTFHAGFFGDWDVDQDFADDVGATELDGRLMYLSNAVGTGSYLGTVLLGNAPVAGNYFFAPAILSLEDQVAALNGALRREQAPDAADYRYIHSAGPITLAPGETADLWIAIVAGASHAELLANAQAAASALAPVADAGGPYAGIEGSAVTFDGRGSYHPAGLPLAYSWTFGDGASGSGITPAHVYTDNGTYTVTLTVSDGVASGTSSGTVTIANVAPVVGAVAAPSAPVPVGTVVTIGASFADPGTADTHAATVDWGDGIVSPAGVVESAGSGSVSDSHAYATPGVYTVVVTVTDDDGGAAQSVYQYVVAYDAEGGYVTGSGWITSPAGAYAADPGATGHATFGFYSRYKPGATAPSGNAMFLFQAAGLRFRSDEFEWLVVAGARAQFKGVGSVNGAGEYGFFISAVDGELAGGGGTDKFRIKIWDRATGVVVYDNQAGAADDTAPATAIGGGSIVVHP
jgi:N-acetylneuraminic acid mutarotase